MNPTSSKKKKGTLTWNLSKGSQDGEVIPLASCRFQETCCFFLFFFFFQTYKNESERWQPVFSWGCLPVERDRLKGFPFPFRFLSCSVRERDGIQNNSSYAEHPSQSLSCRNVRTCSAARAGHLHYLLWCSGGLFWGEDGPQPGRQAHYRRGDNAG